MLHLEYVQKYLRKLPLKFFKIGPVTDKILLIWTNLARTNVTWTIVYLTMVFDCEYVILCSRCFMIRGL